MNAGTFDVIGDFAIAAATLLLAGVTGLFANSYRRRMAIELAEPRRIAYNRLYELTGVAAPSRLDLQGARGALNREERESLYSELTTWYYRDGNGMLLRPGARNMYLKAKRNLVCDVSEIQPRGLLGMIRADLEQDGEPTLDDDTLRGIMSIRQLSLLRTQLKADLAIAGDVFSSTLSRHEREFVIDSKIDLAKAPWRTATEGQVAVERLHRISEANQRILPEIRSYEDIADD